MYYDKVLQDVSKVIQDFFLEEQNNRVTSNNIQGLSLKVRTAFDANKTEPKKKKPLKLIK